MHSYYLHQTATVLSHFAWSRSLTWKRYSHCYIAAYLWCAKHCGIVGNKRADCFANSCRFMPFLIFFIAFLALGDAIFISSAKTSELMFSRDRVSHRNCNIQFRRLFFFFLSTWLAPSSTAPSFITSPSYHSWPIYCNSGSFCCLGFPRIYLSPMIITTITQVYMCGLSLKEIFEIF